MKRKEMPAPPNDRIRGYLDLPDGRQLAPNDVVSIEGLHGTFTFHYGWNDDAGTFWGPNASKTGKWRTFSASRVGKIHKKKVIPDG